MNRRSGTAAFHPIAEVLLKFAHRGFVPANTRQRCSRGSTVASGLTPRAGTGSLAAERRRIQCEVGLSAAGGDAKTAPCQCQFEEVGRTKSSV